MTLPPHTEVKFQRWARKKNLSWVEAIAARELIIKLAKIEAKDKMKQQFKVAA